MPAAHRPGLLATRRLLPDGVRASGDVPHGTTAPALTHRDGVLVAGDRRATTGHLIAQRDLEKVHPADDDSATGGPDLGRGIHPVVTVVTEAGFERLTGAGTEELSRVPAERRRDRPDGPGAIAIAIA